MYQVIAGTFICFGIAFSAYRKKSLTKSGLYCALGMGILLSIIGGLYFLSLLVTFFISSNLIGRFSKKMENQLARIHAKSGVRDYSQVLANGFPAFVFATIFYFTADHIYILGFATAIASSNADTWGSELGVLSKKSPVSIVTWKPIQTGLSGGITATGSLASLAGAMLIAVIFIAGYYLTYGKAEPLSTLFILCTVGGFTGSMIDSILGATVQVKYYCEEQKLITEKRISKSHTNRIISGFPGISNDVVNFTSSFLSALLVMTVQKFL